MIQPDYFSGKADKLISMYQTLEDWILEDIAYRLLKSGDVSGTTDRGLWKLEQMGLHRQEIFKKLSRLTNMSQEELRKVLQDAVLVSYADDKAIFDAQGIVTLSPLEMPSVVSVMDAEWKKTSGELENLTRTTMNQSQQDLINMLDEAEFRVSSGMQSYTQATCDILDNYANKGIMIEYPTGARRNLESAVRCCVVTSMNQAAGQVTNQYIVANGVEYVLTSAHLGARHSKTNPESLESHDWWQGKVFQIKGNDKYPNLLESTGYTIAEDGTGVVIDPLGLHGYNCRHGHQPFYEGMINPWEDATGKAKVNLQESIKKYDILQKQRYMERHIRQLKRMLSVKEAEIANVKDEEIKKQLIDEMQRMANRLNKANTAYKKYVADNKLTIQNDRIRI